MMAVQRRQRAQAGSGRPTPALLCALALAACNGTPIASPQVGAEVIQLRLPGAELQRPAVPFDHAAHATALVAEAGSGQQRSACQRCHPRQADGKLALSVVDVHDLDRDQATDAFHGLCIGCHRQRLATQKKPNGPLTCGECHVRRPAPRTSRAAMRYDYSLHGRHVAALGGDNSCADCHHAADKATGKLVHVKGQEARCADCHKPGSAPGKNAADRTLGLRQASHRACVDCHLERQLENQPTGPIDCQGCHDPTRQQQLDRLAQPPRIDRGQPDRKLIHLAGTRLPAVPFDHRAHEPRARFCSSCHHQTLRACDECHTLAGSAEGGGVRLEQAYHRATSSRSCVGCHQQATREQRCAGCHHALGEPPGKLGCGRCHAGEQPSAPAAATMPAVTALAPASAPTVAVAPRAPRLPPYGDSFPQQVTIDVLQDRYEPSVLPHGRIVARLLAGASQSALARHFHGSVDTLCAGCHHHSPRGATPPPCRSCHGEQADPTRDRPQLLAAYHRQCIGCHQKMSLAVGCTDCHATSGGGAR